MSAVRHLTAPELVRLTEPAPAPAGDAPADAAPGAGHEDARAHLDGCAVCQARAEALRAQEGALADALADLEAMPETPADAARLDALADRMMERLRHEVNVGAAAPEAPARPPLAVVDGGAPRERARPRTALWWAGAGLVALAASLALLLARRPAGEPRREVAAGRDSVPATATPPAPSPGQVAARPETAATPAPRPTPPAPRRAPVVAQGTPVAPDTLAGVGEEELTREGSFLRSLPGQLARVLARYAAALEARDTAAVRAVYPDVPDDTLRALAGARPRGATLALQPRTVRRVSADSAEATVRVSGGVSGPPRALVYAFRRGPDGWLIARAGVP
jgi:hypothetical protein